MVKTLRKNLVKTTPQERKFAKRHPTGKKSWRKAPLRKKSKKAPLSMLRKIFWKKALLRKKMGKMPLAGKKSWKKASVRGKNWLKIFDHKSPPPPPG